MASSRIKRQRKRRRIDTDGEPEFQVAPMVDVLLVLMLFFMAITSTEVLQNEPNLKLATAKNGKTEKEKDKITVNIGWDKANQSPLFTVNEIPYSGATDPRLEAVLASEHQRNPAAKVVIRADKDVEYSNVADLMATCATAGIDSVSFAVKTGGSDEPTPPASPGGTASN